MHAQGTMRFLNKNPYLFMTHKDLARIKYIVDLAPQEAQWFHCVERIVESDTIYYRLTEMLIPEQTCSSAEVDTSPQMMVSFYKQLKEEFGEKTNEIMGNMTCWCHSHHNMGVNPSGQDIKQFTEQIQLAKKRNIDNPQIMIIFNKKNQYYCQLWDPLLDLHIENVPIALEGYDFDYLKDIAKERFKKKEFKPKRNPGFSFGSGAVQYALDWPGSTMQAASSKKNPRNSERNDQSLKARNERKAQDLDWVDDSLLDTLMEDTLSESDRTHISGLLKKSKKDPNPILDYLRQSLNPHEIAILTTLLTGDEDEIRLFEDFFPDEITELDTDPEINLIELYQVFTEAGLEEDDIFTALSIAKLLSNPSITIRESEYYVDQWLSYFSPYDDADFSWELENEAG